MVRRATRVTGVSALDRTLGQLPAEIGKRVLTNGVRAGARVVRDEIRDAAPIRQDTRAIRKSARSNKGRLAGFLKASVRTATRKDTPFSVTIAVTIGQACYGMFLEFGTRHFPARPFIRPAFDRSGGAALAKIGVSLGRGIERAAKKLAGSFEKSGLKRKRRRR